MEVPFEDRADAGQQLAERLSAYRGRKQEVVILGLPRGGVPVAAEVARVLEAPLDVFLVRKLGVPGHEELAMGAIASGGARVLNEGVVRQLRIPDEQIERATDREKREIARGEREFRAGRPPLGVRGKTAILVDDGLATGATMRAAAMALRALEPARIVVAVPVASPDTCDDMRDYADEVICAATPEPFFAVGSWYMDFSPTTDEEVRQVLQDLGRAEARAGAGIERQVEVPDGDVRLTGTLQIPDNPRGIVLFAHGSGSSRFSPRNRRVAGILHDAGFATLLMDLLNAEEERIDRFTAHLRFDIELLAARLVAATDWLAEDPDTATLPVGYFGSSTGAAAALMAEPERPERVSAIVSRGGRPDLAGDALSRVRAPTLLIVGAHDPEVLAMNESALDRLRARDKHLAVVPGATHLFEEPGALDEAAQLATRWFDRHLPKARRAAEELPPPPPA